MKKRKEPTKAELSAQLAELKELVQLLYRQITLLRAEIPNVNIRHDLPFCPGGTRLC